jgi:glucose-1-phosphate adenylyltransferase
VVGEGVTIRNSVVMGADYLENAADVATNPEHKGIPMGIGTGSLVEGAILDMNFRIGRHVQIINRTGVDESDKFDPCFIRDGIPVLTKGAVLEDGWTM